MPYVKTPQNESFPPWTWSEAPLLTGSSRHEPNPEIRNIMITGGAGFIASWVVRHLTTTYGGHYNIVSFDKLDYCASLNNTNQLNHLENFSFYHGDIMKADEVLGCLRKHKIDTVMHFAAQSHVDLSFGNSYDFTYANVYGTHVLLECMKTYGIKKFIHVSTDEVYGEVKDGADDLLEDAILAPTNPYAASKAAAEMMVHAYYKSFKLPVIIVRSNNVYGPHQFPEKVIPKFSLMLQRGLKLPLHGSGDNTRRYLYAGDAADAFDTILHKGEIGHIYNVDSHDEVSTVDLCSHLLRLFNLPYATTEDLYKHVVHTQDRPFNDHRYAVNGDKLRQLGWEQKTRFNEGLRATVQWYQRFGSTWWGNIESRLQPFPEPVAPKVQVDKKRTDSHVMVAEIAADVEL
ncbi:NAD(P)-binding protein, partial [Aureobasidium melanogenum]